MIIKFNEEQLSAEVAVLEGKGIKTEMAEGIAKFKQAMEFAAYFDDSFPFMDREQMPEEVYDKLDNLKGSLEDACESIEELFETDEEVIVNHPSNYRKALYAR